MADADSAGGRHIGLSVDDIDLNAGVVHVVRQVKLLRVKCYLYAAQARLAPRRPVAQLRRRRPAMAPGTICTAAYDDAALTAPGGDPTAVRLLTWTRERGAFNRNWFNHHVWKPALRAAALSAPTRQDGFHALRHFYASVLLDAGESIKALSEYLGHADPGFTLRTYTHFMPNSAERTRRAVDAILGLGHDEGPACPPEGRGTGPTPSDGLPGRPDHAARTCSTRSRGTADQTS